MDPDGANVQTLLAEPGIEQPQWSPDGTRIGFVTHSGPDGEDIGTIKPDGTGRHGVAHVTAVGLSWPMQPGTANKAPQVDFGVDPEQPYTGGTATFTSTATDPDGTIALQQWDLDGDGRYGDASGATATTQFTTPGWHTVGLRVRDDRGTTVTKTKDYNVLQGGKPGAAFTVEPAAPVVGEVTTFTAAVNADPRAQVVRHEWDFDGDGRFDADTGKDRTVQHVYEAAITTQATLRVTDADGDQATRSVQVVVNDKTQCGRETLGRLVLDGCLVVKGPRRIAPQGVTVNGFSFGAAAGAVLAIDRATEHVWAIPRAKAQGFLDGHAAPDGDVPDLPLSICGEDLGTARPDLTKLSGGDALEAPFSLKDGKTFTGLRPSSVSKLKFDDGGVAHFDLNGLFPKLLLNWTAEARGTYASDPDCAKRKLTVKAGSFLSRFVKFPEVRLERTGQNDWEGILPVQFPHFDAFGTVEARVKAPNGHISTATFAVNDVPLTGGLNLKSSALTIRLDHAQEELSGRVTLTTFPEFRGRTAVELTGAIRFSGTGMHLEGLLNVMGVGLGYGYLDINSDLSIDLGVEAEFTLGPAYAKAEVSGFVKPTNLSFEVFGSGEVGIKGIGHLGADLLVSSKGIAACGHVGYGVGSVDPGFSYRYGDTWPTVFLDSCDFGGLRVARGASARAAASSSRTVRVGAGRRAVVLVAKGRPGHAPRVAVSGPRGQRITSKRNGQGTRKGRFLVVPNKQDGTTNVLVMQPAAGTWRIKALDGRTLRSVGTADALPEPSVKARRKGKALRWTLRPIAGQTVTLVEVTKAGARRELVKATTKARGTVRYAPTAGAARIVAEVTQNGLLRETRTVVRLTKATKKK
jgi:PKD repeat protein